MVDFRIILQLVVFIVRAFYDGVALIVIPDCIEEVIFYAKIVVAEHIEVREQIQGLKIVIAYILLVLVIGNITLIRFQIGTGKNLLQNRVSCLCIRSLQKEWEREVLKGLLISEQTWLHRF